MFDLWTSRNVYQWSDEVKLLFFFFRTYTVPLEKVNQPPLSRVVGFLDLHEKNQDFEACCLQPRGLNLISKYPLQYVIFTHNLFNLSPETNVGSHFLFKVPYLFCYCLAWYKFLTFHKCCEFGSGIRCFFTTGPGSEVSFFWDPEPGSRIPEPGSWILDPRSRIHLIRVLRA